MNVLVVEPTQFNIKTLFMNPYMTGKIRINLKKAISQWRALVDLLESLGITVIKKRGIKNLVDMVFTANAGSIIDNIFYPSNFYHKERQGESIYYKKYFTQLGYKIIPITGYFEGQGDTQYSHDKEFLWVGYGQRTSHEGANSFISNAYNSKNKVKCKLLHLIDPYFYHLDTCLRCFGNKYAIYYPGAFSKESKQLLLRIFGKTNMIAVKRSEALQFVCNTIEIKHNNILIAHYFTDRIKDKLNKIGFTTLETDMSEFLLSGGSVKCCILDLLN